MRLAFLRLLLFLVATVWCGSLSHVVQADEFGGGANAFSIEFVTIGNPGNPADRTGQPNPAGSVSYAYRIGKYEISEQMIDKANALGSLGITHDNRGPDKPASFISWFDAAIFINWLNESTGHTPAYKFDEYGDFQLWAPGDLGYDPANLFRNTQAKYFLPSNDEWYKAAYYDPIVDVYWDYPTGSNSPPTAVASGTAAGTAIYNQSTDASPADVMQAGGLSPYGTMAQGGNVYERIETSFDSINDRTEGSPFVRGGAWAYGIETLTSSALTSGSFDGRRPYIGFRVASVVPEPNAIVMVVTITLILLGSHRQRVSSET